MVRKRVEHIKEIEAYIKFRTKLGQSVVQMFNELGDVYESDKVSNGTLRRRRRISDWNIVRHFWTVTRRANISKAYIALGISYNTQYISNNPRMFLCWNKFCCTPKISINLFNFVSFYLEALNKSYEQIWAKKMLRYNTALMWSIKQWVQK